MSTSGRSFSRYLRHFGALVIALLIMTAAVNAVVNPYGVFDAPAINGFNSIKVRAGEQRELFKTVGVRSTRYATVILGNSRAEIGFDPASSAWPPSMGPIYNLAQAGGNLRSSARMLSTAASSFVPRAIVLGVDLPEFLSAPGEASVPVLRIGSEHAHELSVADWVNSLASLDTLSNSIQTVARQRDPLTEQLTSLGFNPLFEYRAITKREGFRALFEQKNAEYAARYAGSQLTLYPHQDGASPDIGQLREILAFCRMHQIHVTLVIYPYHAELLEILANTGLWETYEDWKRLLVRTVATESTPQFHPGLWDFGVYAPYTTEPVPQSRDLKTPVRWFWESGHFRPELGDLMLREIFLGQGIFGARLSQSTIEGHLLAIRNQRSDYRASHAAEVGKIAALVQQVRATAPK